MIQALKAYLRTRDYCTTNMHTTEMGLNAIRVSFDNDDIRSAKLNLSKIEQTCREDKLLFSKYKTFMALLQLHEKDYQSAALSFISIDPNLSGNFPEVIAPEDIAIYAVVCSLASFGRKYFKEKILENYEFKNYLDLVPDIRTLSQSYVSGQYALFFSSLETLRTLLVIDIHISNHIDSLFLLIKENCFSQYLTPYSTVDLNKMSEVMQINEKELESFLAKMISSNKLTMVIDSATQTLYQKKNNQRKEALSKVLKVSKTQIKDLRAILLKISLLKHNFTIEGEGDFSRSLVNRSGAETGTDNIGCMDLVEDDEYYHEED